MFDLQVSASNTATAAADKPAPAHVKRFHKVRQATLGLIDGLSDEDMCLQSMADASPAKWHLAHTTWFFEELILKPFDSRYRCFNDRFDFLFNAYYEAIGDRHRSFQPIQTWPEQSPPERASVT